MGLTYGEFCTMFKCEESADTFRVWLLTHTLPRALQRRCIAKAMADEEASWAR